MPVNPVYVYSVLVIGLVDQTKILTCTKSVCGLLSSIIIIRVVLGSITIVRCYYTGNDLHLAIRKNWTPATSSNCKGYPSWQ